MKLVDGTPVRQRKTRDTFSKRDASRRELLSILSYHVARCSVTLVLVVKVNDASIERHHVPHLVDQNLESMLNVQRRSKRAGNFIQGINLSMRFLYLIVSDVRAPLSSLSHVNV